MADRTTPTAPRRSPAGVAVAAAALLLAVGVTAVLVVRRVVELTLGLGGARPRPASRNPAAYLL